MSNAAVYRSARERFCAICSELFDEELGARVPACPDWTVADLFAHVVGVAADSVAGNVETVGQPQWTAAHVEAGKHKSVQELASEWESSSAAIESSIDALHPAIGGMLIADLATHEHDLRGAVARPGERDSDAVRIAAYTYARFFGRRIKDNELPAVRISAGDKTWDIGAGETAGELSTTPFELLRALAGRRTRAEIRDLGWTCDPEPYLSIFSMYGMPDRSLGE